MIPYWQQRQQMKLKGGAKPAEKLAEKKQRAKFFTEKIKKAPAKCENCGKSLAGTMAINAAAIVAHILPKSKTYGCPSVATNPLNTWYACGDCHTNFDKKGSEFVQKMKVFPILKERVAEFYDAIAQGERKRVPDHFKP